MFFVHSDYRSFAAIRALNYVPQEKPRRAGSSRARSVRPVLRLSALQPVTRDHSAGVPGAPNLFPGSARRPIFDLSSTTADPSLPYPTPELSLGQSRMALLFKFPVQQNLSHLLVFALRGAQQVAHANPLAVVGCEKSRGHRNVVYIASGYLEAPGHEIQIKIRSTGGVIRPDSLPDTAAIGFVRKGKLHRKMEAPYECLVHVLSEVGRQNDDAFVFLHPLQQITDLDVGVAIMGVFDLAPFSEQRIRLIEEQNGIGRFGLDEYTSEILFRLSDVLADHGRKIDLIKIEIQLPGDDFGRHGLAGPRGSGKEHAEPFTPR